MLRSQLFAGNDGLDSVARQVEGALGRLAGDPEGVRLLQQALLRWDSGCLPIFGVSGRLDDETLWALARFAHEHLGRDEDEAGPLGPRAGGGARRRERRVGTEHRPRERRRGGRLLADAAALGGVLRCLHQRRLLPSDRTVGVQRLQRPPRRVRGRVGVRRHQWVGPLARDADRAWRDDRGRSARGGPAQRSRARAHQPVPRRQHARRLLRGRRRQQDGGPSTSCGASPAVRSSTTAGRCTTLPSRSGFSRPVSSDPVGCAPPEGVGRPAVAPDPAEVALLYALPSIFR